MEEALPLYESFYPQLEARYGSREAHSMLLILWEDLLGLERGRKKGQISHQQAAELRTAVDRLLTGEPLQYIVGFTYFLDLKIHVAPAVLIPRPETEELVVWIQETLQTPHEPPGKLLDIGTGSGCIPLALQSRLPAWECQGMDVSEAAVDLARQNALENQLEVRFWKGDLLTLLPEQMEQYSVWVSNPPYITREEKELLPENVREHEPESALFVTNSDPLQFYRAIAALVEKQTAGSLRWVFLECHETFAREVKALFDALSGVRQAELREDLQGKPRMLRVQLQT